MHAGRFPDAYVMEAYEKLIHDCMQGEHANFVRNDELRESWKVRSPHASPPEPAQGAKGAAGSALLLLLWARRR